MAPETPDKDTLYYDGECPICSAEIKRLAEHTDERIELIDINRAEHLPVDKNRLFSELHLFRSNGDVLIGLDANVAAWKHTKWAKVASILQWPVVHWFARQVYSVWLWWYQHQRTKRLLNTK